MIFSSEVFTNYLGDPVTIIWESWVHISQKHPEITLDEIKKTLLRPDFVLLSEISPQSELYFLRKSPNESKIRFSVVVVKIKDDGLWISTAMTKNKVSSGIEIYRRIQC